MSVAYVISKKITNSFIPCTSTLEQAILMELILLMLYMLHFQEMNLLVEADQPGNQLDDYVSRLNAILSQKAAGIMQLQTQLAHFQKRLKEHNVLVSSGY